MKTNNIALTLLLVVVVVGIFGVVSNSFLTGFALKSLKNQVETGSLTVFVLEDGSSKPLKGAQVSLNLLEPFAGILPSTSAVTNEKGKIVFDDLPTNVLFSVTVSLQDYTQKKVSKITLVKGMIPQKTVYLVPTAKLLKPEIPVLAVKPAVQQKQEIVVPVKSAKGLLAFYVKDPKGRLIKGAEIFIRSASEAKSGVQYKPYQKTDSGGYAVVSLDQGDYEYKITGEYTPSYKKTLSKIEMFDAPISVAESMSQADSQKLYSITGTATGKVIVVPRKTTNVRVVIK